MLFFVYSNSYANNKIEIINNLNNIETLKFDFVQKSFDKKEYGVCYLKRPAFLKCSYEDKKQKHPKQSFFHRFFPFNNAPIEFGV